MGNAYNIYILIIKMFEKFCLKWNDFQANVTKSFSNLRKEDDFFDVTLVSDDKQQVSAHKLVLSSCSDYFKSIFKQNKHSHPLLCLEGISSSELNNVLDYIYNGQVQVMQDNLERFLEIASRFQLEGLIGGENVSDEVKEEATNAHIESEPEVRMLSSSQLQHQDSKPKNVPKKNNFAVAASSNLNTEDIDKQLDELMEKEGSQYRCKSCGKMSSRKLHAYEHAENHMEGLSYNCHMCDKTFRLRSSHRNHVTRYCPLGVSSEKRNR